MAALTSAIGILSLPPEITIEIVKQLPGAAIKAVRASCKQLNPIASPYLFPVLYISCHQLDLDVFRLVANNPILIGGVRELVIDDTTLSTCYSDRRVYRSAACAWKVGDRVFPDDSTTSFSEQDPAWAHEPDKEGYELFMNTLRGHHENRLAHADIHALKKALPRFESLRSLVVTNRNADEFFLHGAQSVESGSPVFKTWKRAASRMSDAPPFPPRCDWITNEVPLMDRTPINTLDWLDDHQDERFLSQRGIACRLLYAEEAEVLAREARVIFVALQVLENSDLRSQLTEFRVDASRDIRDGISEPGIPITLFDQQSPFPERLATGFAATNMTKFQLVINNHASDADSSDIMLQGRLGHVLASMPQLEVLLLELHCIDTVAAIPTDMIFPRLLVAEFCCGIIAVQKLLDFLRRHGATLKELRILYCSINPEIDEESWSDVISHMGDLQAEGILELGSGMVSSNVYAISSNGCGRDQTLYIDGVPFDEDETITWIYDGEDWETVSSSSDDDYRDEEEDDYDEEDGDEEEDMSG
ncbi:hypothetical protein ACHAPJ_008719 [Fusarium lateritium]